MKKLKVLLIATLTGEGARYVKHGLGLISACLKKEGHIPLILNNPNRTKRTVTIFQPDMVGISGLSNSLPKMLRCAHIARKLLPKAPVFAGGVTATLSPDLFEDRPVKHLFDYVFCGEAEITFTKLINEYAATGSLPTQRKIQGEVLHDLDNLPFVDRQGYENGELKHNLLSNYSGRMFTMLNSRWCRKNCRFCAPASKTIFGGIKKLRSVRHFIDEIKTLPSDALLMIHDDNMIENAEWAFEFAENYQHLSNPFICQAYPAEIVRAEQLLVELKKIGLVGVLVGFESGSNRMLRYMRKGTTTGINKSAAEILHKLGIRIQANLMFGSPTESYEEMMETVNMFNEHIYPAIPSPAVYTPYPGSYWYENLKKQGLISINDPRQYERHSYTYNKIRGVNYEDVQRAVAQLKSNSPRWKKSVQSLRYQANKVKNHWHTFVNSFEG